MTGSPLYPSIPRRLTSMVYESLLLFGLVAVGFILPHALLGTLAQVVAPSWVVRTHFILLLMLYYVWFWLNGGQTLAMKTWKIQVQDRSGAPLRPLQAVLRYLAAWPSLLFFGIGVFWALFDKDRQFLHDRIAGSRLILIAPEQKPAKS
ncbi:RDD family protein [Azovibrio restrictus]|uniref:RDD family protein n=1 Tax=Azovibrio restrictus TaxID=146938 RepID=UPI0003F99A6A|nr:RDD family protein [Azovibrio restrictus]